MPGVQCNRSAEHPSLVFMIPEKW